MLGETHRGLVSVRTVMVVFGLTWICVNFVVWTIYSPSLSSPMRGGLSSLLMFRSRGPFNQAEQQRPSHVTFVRGKYGDDAHGAESHNSASWAARESSAPLCCSGDGSFAKGEMQEGGGRTWNEYKVCRDIDVVYTWVNGSDPAHRMELSKYRKGTSWNGMFRDYGVLRFSVRSIAAFMPYVRDVIIVTNGQVPTWLNTSAPGIRIVTHKEIFHNSSDLPTFNSNAIEAHLHNIPGIAECFLYMNDDFFLMRDTPRTHWVDEETGKIKVYMEGGKAPQADKGGWFKSVAHSNEIVNKYYRPNENRSNPTRHHYVGHYCYFTLTEIADLMYSRWQSEFDRTSHNKFRQNNDTAFPFLNANVALEENRAIISKAPNGHSSWTSNTTKNTKTWDTIMSRSPFCVCLQDRFNDNATAVDIEIAHLESLLCETFPSPSRFERMDVSNPCSNVQKH